MLAPLLQFFWIDDTKKKDVCLKRLAMNPDLVEPLRLHKYIFKFLGRDVLTSSCLENVFASINDSDGTIWIDKANIA